MHLSLKRVKNAIFQLKVVLIQVKACRSGQRLVARITLMTLCLPTGHLSKVDALFGVQAKFEFILARFVSLHTYNVYAVLGDLLTVP